MRLGLYMSAGEDMLLNEMFVHGKNILAPSICVIFNHLLHIGHFPDMWTEGLIIPVHKKGDMNEVGNYRGITLLSTMEKLFTVHSHFK